MPPLLILLLRAPDDPLPATGSLATADADTAGSWIGSVAFMRLYTPPEADPEEVELTVLWGVTDVGGNG